MPFCITNSSLCPTGLWPGVWVRCPAPGEGIEDGNRIALHLQLRGFFASLEHLRNAEVQTPEKWYGPTSNACNFTLPGACAEFCGVCLKQLQVTHAKLWQRLRARRKNVTLRYQTLN